MNPRTTCEPRQTATAFAGTTATATAAGSVSWSFASPAAATPPGATAAGPALMPVTAAETQHPAPSTSSAASMIVVPGPLIVVQRYEYTGRELASETSGYYFFRYRVYGPALGQFFARDPLGYEDGMGLYGGVFAQRQGMDPTGRKGDLPPGGQAPQGQNCFGYCFGLNEWWGERVNAYTFVILEKENGNILGKKVVPLCEQGKRQQEAVTTKAKVLRVGVCCG